MVGFEEGDWHTHTHTLQEKSTLTTKHLPHGDDDVGGRTWMERGKRSAVNLAMRAPQFVHVDTSARSVSHMPCEAAGVARGSPRWRVILCTGTRERPAACAKQKPNHAPFGQRGSRGNMDRGRTQLEGRTSQATRP